MLLAQKNLGEVFVALLIEGAGDSSLGSSVMSSRRQRARAASRAVEGPKETSGEGLYTWQL